jgi:hypothetical protein
VRNYLQDTVLLNVKYFFNSKCMVLPHRGALRFDNRGIKRSITLYETIIHIRLTTVVLDLL